MARTIGLLLRQDLNHANVNETHCSGSGEANTEDERRGRLKAVPTLSPLARTAIEDT
jgi:hypothetical protein